MILKIYEGNPKDTSSLYRLLANPVMLGLGLELKALTFALTLGRYSTPGLLFRDVRFPSRLPVSFGLPSLHAQ